MLNQAYELKPDSRYPMPEIIDRMAKSWFGEERGLEWFQENGLVRIPRDVEEAYIGPFIHARLPVYLEHFLQRGEELKEVTDGMGLKWDFSDYVPLPEWLPCPAYDAVKRDGFDL